MKPESCAKHTHTIKETFLFSKDLKWNVPKRSMSTLRCWLKNVMDISLDLSSIISFSRVHTILYEKKEDNSIPKFPASYIQHLKGCFIVFIQLQKLWFMKKWGQQHEREQSVTLKFFPFVPFKFTLLTCQPWQWRLELDSYTTSSHLHLTSWHFSIRF